VKFNKDQREGLAKVLDNIATAFIIGVIIGSVTDHKVAFLDGFVICCFAVILVLFALRLRGIKEIENVN
jgi:hypothetical protein